MTRRQSSRPIPACIVMLAIAIATGSAGAGTIISAAAESNGEPEGIQITGDMFTHVNAGTYTVPAFGEDVLSYTDRTHQWNGLTGAGLPLALVGGDYVMTANDARDNSAYQLNVTLAQTANLYVLRDRRDAGSLPAWFGDGVGIDLIPTGTAVGNDNSGDGTGPGSGIDDTMDVFIARNAATGSTTLSAGTYQLLQSETTGHGMYGVVATDQPVVFPQAQPFSVTLDIGPEGQRVQSGHTGVPSPNDASTPDNNANGQMPGLVPVAMGTGTVLVSFSNINASGGGNGGIDWRDRGDSTNGAADLVQMAEDFIKNNGGIIRLSLVGLPAGTYNATSFHTDASNTQCEAIKVRVDNSDGSGFVEMPTQGDASLDLGGINGLTTDDIQDTAAHFQFTADGVNPVVIIWDGSAASDTEVPLAGLHLAYVPEPATLALAAIGLGGLRRRRRA